MNDSKRHLLICAIGPVQDFIATARSSRDLWFGSYMLSELSKAAAKSLEDASHELVFPAPGQDLSQGPGLSVANKIVALVGEDPEAVAREVGSAVDRRLQAMYENMPPAIRNRDGISWDLANEQIDDLVEFYWAFAPFEDESPTAYTTARDRAEAYLVARKNTRDFDQARGRVGVSKSSLDGMRESVLPRRPANTDDSTWYKTYRAHPGELLSGVDLLKRWGRFRSFSSTSDIAARPFLSGISETKKQTFLRRVEERFGRYATESETPGTYVYAERLTQLIGSEAKRRRFREGFEKIFNDVFEENGVTLRPSPYYGLLLADGDNMGRTINAQKSRIQHQKLSQRLSEFARDAKTIIHRHEGEPIYVGGDDILTYLPLHRALSCIHALDTAFQAKMGEFSHRDGEGMHAPTLSGGLIIAHHLTPLSDVLESARRTERKAKNIPGKHGLAIVLSRRSGIDRTISARMPDLLKRVQTLIHYTRQGLISAGTSYELIRLHQELQGDTATSQSLVGEAIRIIRRKRQVGGMQELQWEVRNQFKIWFKDQDVSLDGLAQEMVIAGEFAAAYDTAALPHTAQVEEVDR
jgi:CRISPR-associated protein Cmr2